MTRVVLATRNQGKVRELQAMLEGKDIEVLGLDRFPEIGEIEETGSTFEENARIKAKAVSEATGLIALADDSGLAVDALGGEPGVRSARYSGEGATDASNNGKLLAAMKNVPEGERGCRFVCCVAVHAPGGAEAVFHGKWEGRLAEAPRGANGFGYDPLFIDPELGLTAAEIAPEEKNGRSHRGKAVRELAAALPSLLRQAEAMAGLSPAERAFKEKYEGVKGWLLLLCAIMIFLAPLSHCFTIFNNSKMLRFVRHSTDMDPEIASKLITLLTMESVLLAALAMFFLWAGFRLYNRKPRAVMWAKAAWGAVVAYNVIVTGYLYAAALPEEVGGPMLSQFMKNGLLSLLGVFIWVSFLTYSKRVRATYFMDRA